MLSRVPSPLVCPPLFIRPGSLLDRNQQQVKQWSVLCAAVLMLTAQTLTRTALLPFLGDCYHVLWALPLACSILFF